MRRSSSWTDQEAHELNEHRSASDRAGLLSNPDLDDDEVDSHLLGSNAQSAYPSPRSNWARFLRSLRFVKHRYSRNSNRNTDTPYGSSARLLLRLSGLFLIFLVALGLIYAPYTKPPPHYTQLRKRIESAESSVPGAGNIHNQKVYIAASIFDKDGDLAGGAWGECVLKLIHLLGPDNTYLSIYENDAGNVAENALKSLEKRVQCKSTLRYDEHLSFDEVDHVTLPDGSSRVKRIAYLSEARNRALLPLKTASVQYDKLLYLNDVVFDPIEVVQLLFLTGTDANGNGLPDYRAACAIDFINPIKYYDTFATRDYEGYGIGLPFFPWFTTVSNAVSRSDVMAGSDAVRVRSCWGGLVAFDAQFFQPRIGSVSKTAGSESPANMSAPYGFRAEPDLFWDASECCLIHADIQAPDSTHSGIYMNPYVRTAYDTGTLSWLNFMRRFERLCTPVHWIITKAVGMPWYNARRAERAWEEVEERAWNADTASFEMMKRTATHSGFCGRPALQVMKLDMTKGGKPWEFIPLPG